MRAIILVLLAAIPVSGAQIAGTWRLTGKIADVTINRVCTIQQTDNRIQGPCKNQMGETTLIGEVNGDQVTWKYEAKYEGTTVVLVFKGKVESDSKIEGTITAADPAGNYPTTGTFSATRSEEALRLQEGTRPSFEAAQRS
jgi:hypothetical protein